MKCDTHAVSSKKQFDLIIDDTFQGLIFNQEINDIWP